MVLLNTVSGKKVTFGWNICQQIFSYNNLCNLNFSCQLDVTIIFCVWFKWNFIIFTHDKGYNFKSYGWI